MNKAIDTIIDIVKDALKDDIPGLASEMAFNFILSLFPFAIFLISIFGLLGTENVVEQIINPISAVAPANVINLIEQVLNGIIQSSSGELLTIGFLASIWAASNATMVIMKALNRAYNIPEARPFWQTRGWAILMVFKIAFIIFLAVNMIVFGTTTLDFISRYFYIPDDVFITILFVRWPITFAAFLAVALAIYYFLPNAKTSKTIRLKSSIPGALFFCVFWLVASWAFSIYVENFGKYNQVYGTLGAAIVLLIWLYYTSLVILIGGEINSHIFKKLQSRVVEVKTN